MKVIHALSESHVVQLHALYEGEWWTKGRSLEETRRGVAGSQLCVGLLDDEDRLLGFTRVLTDFTFKALIFDLIVTRSSRRAGLGERLIGLVKSNDKLRAVKHFELYCLPELYRFYRRFGFTEDVGEVRLMRCQNG